MSKSVCVVMSTYNGDKYLEEQLESLFNQSYNNMKIFVRDDGSKDNTIKILDKYKKQGKLDYVKGKNLGYTKSFIETLKLAGEFDYYSFCDQDDVWFPNKVEEAVKKLDTMDSSKPLLYFSNLLMCDGDLNYIRTIDYFKIITFANSLVEINSFGNTSVINKELRDILVNYDIKYAYTHDGYIGILAHGLGEVYYDRFSYIKYRKHGNNVSDQGMSFIKLQIWRIKKFIINDFFAEMKKQNIEFYELFSEKLKPEDKKLLELFIDNKYNFINCLKKVFYPRRFRNKLIDEILLRIIFVTGKI